MGAGGAALILGADNSKSPSKVLSDLLDDSIRNAISGLQSGDTNALLYVGSGSAPSPPSLCAHTPYTTDGWVRAPERLRCEPMVHGHRIRSLVPKPGCKLPCALLHACLRAVHSEGGSQLMMLLQMCRAHIL